jgi:hypothetical protein
VRIRAGPALPLWQRLMKGMKLLVQLIHHCRRFLNGSSAPDPGFEPFLCIVGCGGLCCCIDCRDHVYLPAARLGPVRPGSDPAVVPGTFRVLVVGPL